MFFPSAETFQIIFPILTFLFLGLSFFRPIWGVIAYFIVLNTKLGDMYPALGAIRIEFIAAMVVFISIFLSGKGISNFLPNTNKLNKYLWIFFLIGMASVPQAVSFWASWHRGGYELIKVTLFYMMVAASINNRNDLDKMVLTFMLISAWIAYEPVTNYLKGAAESYMYGNVAYGRFGAATGHVALSNTLNQSIPLAYFSILDEKKKNN